jgi:hypothetical protein
MARAASRSGVRPWHVSAIVVRGIVELGYVVALARFRAAA